tara:strand:- start:4057 stop:4491 length:435 start_codon:yes stop_codon:yes gene_type:complete
MINILIIISIILLVFFFIVTAFANGFIRGVKTMSIRNIEKSPLEEKILKQYFKQNEDVDPFFYSKYIQEEIVKNNKALKESHLKNVETKKIIDGNYINNRSKKVWYAKQELSKTDKIMIVRVSCKNSKTRFSSIERFLKNYTKI